MGWPARSVRLVSRNSEITEVTEATEEKLVFRRALGPLTRLPALSRDH
jgi:hypothetical protein